MGEMGEMFSDLALENQQKAMEQQLLRITPENITKLKRKEIFVFGSNEAGMHSAGAAKIAHEKFRAVYGVGFGFGFEKVSFAIPTKDWNISKLDLPIIQFYVWRFLAFARNRQDLKFLVTEIGCGLAGYTPEEIAPMFREAVNLENVYLPQRFWNILNNNN